MYNSFVVIESYTYIIYWNHVIIQLCSHIINHRIIYVIILSYTDYSKKSPTGPTEQTPKPEYLIAPATSFRGPLVRSHSIFDGIIQYLGGGFKYFLFSSLVGEMIQLD